jgi:hypothetical protein
MASVSRASKAVVTDGAGDATAYTVIVNGILDFIQYVKTDYTDGVDFTITEEDTGAALWTGTNVNASTIVSPRRATHSDAGAAAVYAVAGSPVLTPMSVAGRIKIVIAAGGAAKTGAFTFQLL